MMDLATATSLLRSIDLPHGDYAIFGSAPLLAHGIIDSVADLDIIARGAAWDQGIRTGDLIYLPEHEITVCSFYDKLVTMGRTWAYGELDIDTLIDTAETVAGLPFVRIEFVIEYKQMARRPKDLDHLASYETWKESADDGGH